jgi:hypothetical protein
MTQFSGRMRDFYENGGFDIEFRGQTRRYRYIAAVMITHVYINENLKYEPFVKYMTKTLNENNIFDFSHRPKALQSHESDGVIFLTFKYPYQSVKVIEIFDEKYFGDDAIKGKSLTCKPNGFTNLGCVSDYMTERYRDQVDSVRLFNERYYVRVVNTNYNWLTPSRAHEVYHARRQFADDDYNNDARNQPYYNDEIANLQRRLNFNQRGNNHNRSSRSSQASNDDNNTTAQNHNSATISVKAEQNSDVNVSVRMRTDNGNNNGAAANKKRKLSGPKSPENRSKQIDVTNVKLVANDNDVIIIEKLSVVDQAKQDLEAHMGSQPFDCARCGLRLIGNQVISHRCKVPPLDDNNNNFYS